MLWIYDSNDLNSQSETPCAFYFYLFYYFLKPFVKLNKIINGWSSIKNKWIVKEEEKKTKYEFSIEIFAFQFLN